ncbi:hypothetical protein BJ138DRAFT_1151546 [Hygrophoropsis aurantiaca]|uniref:Uncharacterized protein n=1 Tax=Hygrophoropsis aurantiaca TaxID=72124 RepID=A0ACB8ADC8_9AGAM|nr:hypothetical protein BJ138DRAFT_1151546 [Hygrophoropsis aurantiaca]
MLSLLLLLICGLVMASLASPEHFRNDGANTWTCLRCPGSCLYQPIHSAIRHEMTQKHSSEVRRYCQELHAAQMSAIDQDMRTHYAEPSLTNPAFDAIFSAAGIPLNAAHHPDHDLRYFQPHSPAITVLDNHPYQPVSPFCAPQHAPTSDGLGDEDTYNGPDYAGSNFGYREISHHEQLVAATRDTLHGMVDHGFDPSGVESDDEEDVYPENNGDEFTVNVNVSFSRRRRANHVDNAATNTWRPWSDRLSCTLDIVSNLPRGVFSDDELDILLWLLEENGVRGTPSIYQIRDLGRRLNSYCGIELKHFVGCLGHTYYTISLESIVKTAFSNPISRHYLEVYPEDSGPKLEEMRQAKRWLDELDPHLLTPMHRVGNRDFYSFEPTLLKNGTICMPSRFLKINNQIWFRAWPIVPFHTMELGHGWLIEQCDELTLAAENLSANSEELKYLRIGPNGQDLQAPFSFRDPHTKTIQRWSMPLTNSWRLKAKGHRVVAYPVLLYCDDTSGNKSKKWNEHNSFLMNAAGLPREHMQREYNLNFLCTSNIAPPLEMLEGVVDQFESSQETGIWAYDCLFGELVLVIVSILALLGDNPMQSEFACHAGLMSKFFCRCCWVKGKDINDMIEENGVKVEAVHTMVSRIKRFMQVGRQRIPTETQRVSRTMLENASTMARQKDNADLQTSTGVKDTILRFFIDKVEKAKKSLRGDAARRATQHAYTQLPAKVFSPVWRIRDLNPHCDTPVEILHVILLGFLKYFWRDAIGRLSDIQKEVLKARLSSFDVSGLGPDISKLRGHTLVQYAGSLVGRDFRLISQVAVFVLYDLLNRNILDAWAALCTLVPLVWQPKIDNIDHYMVELKAAIKRFLDCTARWTPRWFNKPKFHLIVHLLDHIRRFGPAIIFATEGHESYNSIIRGWSVNSNRQAPSRDIAQRAAGLLRLRHLISGGFFEVETEEADGIIHKEWICAGPAALALGQLQSVITRKLGFLPIQSDARGSAKLIRPTQPVLWGQTAASGQLAPPSGVSPRVTFYLCQEVIVDNGDQITIEDFAIFQVGEEIAIGRTTEILMVASERIEGKAHWLLLQHYLTGELVQPYSMPSLQKTAHFSLVKPKHVLCAVNVQHNCAAHNCDLSASRPVFLERERQAEEGRAVRHYEIDDIVLNTAKMRDAKYISMFRKSPPPLDTEQIVQLACESELASGL